MQQPRTWWAVVVIAVVLILAVRAIETEHREVPQAGAPKTAEVAETLRNEGPLSKRQVTSAGCRETSPGHWSCIVNLAGGTEATVQATWDGRRQAISYSLISERRSAP